MPGYSRRIQVATVLGLFLLTTVSCGGAAPSAGDASTMTAQPLPTLDPALIDRGKGIYNQYCASCHGPEAEGAPNWQQPNERDNLSAPPHDDSGHTWRHGDGELFEMIHDGWRDPFNKTQDLTMPAFGDTLNDAEIRAVIIYFKSLWSKEHRRYQFEESQDSPFPRPS